MCLPHAGAGSLAYFHWAGDFGADVEVCAVQLPGRENRLRERAIDELGRLLPRLVEGLGPTLRRGPFALFGHSFGALLAFELTRELRRRGAALPRALIVSGRGAPALGAVTDPIGGIADDDEFLAALDRRYGGIPAAIRGERELLALMLPTLRADLRIAEAHEYRAEEPLPLPIMALGGIDDPAVDEASLSGWARETSAGFALRRFRGGHFFVQESRQDVTRAVRGLLEGG